MSIKTAITRDKNNFDHLYVYRELTYKLAYGRFKDHPGETDAVFAHLSAVAKEPPPDGRSIEELVGSIGLLDYELSKVEEFLVPETLNTAWRGIATKGTEEIRFYVERP